nr:WRKY62 [Persea americana]
MAGMDENVAVLGDWAMAPNPSPRTFFSSFLSDDVNSISFPDLLGNNGIDGPFQRPEKQQMGSNSEDDKVGGGVPGDCLSESGDVFSGHKLSSRGGLAERVAARAGFNAPRLNTARIRSSNMLPSSSPEVRSPYLTIPPGLSPTSLLESPVLLSNSKVQPSPTTGKFPFVQCNSRSSMSISAVPDKDKDHMTKDADSESFVFKPHVETSSSYFQSVANKVMLCQFFFFFGSCISF